MNLPVPFFQLAQEYASLGNFWNDNYRHHADTIRTWNTYDFCFFSIIAICFGVIVILEKRKRNLEMTQGKALSDERAYFFI